MRKRMDNNITQKSALSTKSETRSFFEGYRSVEFSIRNLSFNYQFKLWDADSDSVQIIIRDDSDILHWLKVGSRFESKFYSDENIPSINELETEISHIKKADEGRFKGHYLVRLSVPCLRA